MVDCLQVTSTHFVRTWRKLKSVTRTSEFLFHDHFVRTEIFSKFHLRLEFLGFRPFFLLCLTLFRSYFNGSDNSPEKWIEKSRFFAQGLLWSRDTKRPFTRDFCVTVNWRVCCGSLIKSNSWSIFFQARSYECPAWNQVATTCCVNCVTRKRP